MNVLTQIAGAVLDFAPPLVLAALGGVLSERAGVVNLGLEGMMRFGAFFAAAGAIWTGSPWLGLAIGALAGTAAAGLHAYATLRWRADQIVSGIALNLVALGLVTFLLEALFGSSATMPEAAPALPRWLGHSPLTWLALALPFALHLLFYRTVAGLRLRAVGEHPRAAAAAGIRVLRVRLWCVLGSGALAGLGGSALSVSILDRFENRMPAGAGFMALAAVVFGKWTPLGAFGAALFFAFADAAQRQFALATRASDLHLGGLFLALPYALTLLVLAGFVGRATPPAADGVPYDPEARS